MDRSRAVVHVDFTVPAPPVPSVHAGVLSHRMAWLGETSTVAIGDFGSDLLDQALDWTDYAWTLVKPVAAATATLFVLLDPSERGASAAAVVAIQEAKAMGRLVFAVVKRPRNGAPKYGRVFSEIRYLKRVATLVLMIPEPGNSPEVIWQALIETAVSKDDPSRNFFDGISRLFKKSDRAMQAIACSGQGGTPEAAVRATLIHSSNNPSIFREVRSVLTVITVGGPIVQLDEVDRAFDLIKSIFDNKIYMENALCFTRSTQPPNKIHILAIY